MATTREITELLGTPRWQTSSPNFCFFTSCHFLYSPVCLPSPSLRNTDPGSLSRLFYSYIHLCTPSRSCLTCKLMSMSIWPYQLWRVPITDDVDAVQSEPPLTGTCTTTWQRRCPVFGRIKRGAKFLVVLIVQ